MKSPNYPNSYPPDTKCSYVFRSTSGSSIKLHFVDFDLTDEETPKSTRSKCTGDTLRISEDPSKSLLSTEMGPSTVYNGGGNINIHLVNFITVQCTAWLFIPFLKYRL